MQAALNPGRCYPGDMSINNLFSLQTAICLALATSIISCQVVVHDGYSVSHSSKTDHNHARLSDLDSFLGTWVQADENGAATDEVVTEFASTAGGSVVIETLFRGQPHEMVTMYYSSPEGLFMTHYCAGKNHPNMAASID